MQNRKSVVMKIIAAVFFIGAFVLFGMAAYRYWEYRSGELVYEELEDNFTGKDHGGKDREDEDTDDFTVDWDALLAQNKDVVGWIRMASGANYPILHGESDEEYVYHDINRSYNINGSIFLHYANSGKWYDKNSLIYGHNMNSGAMFGSNRKYKDEAYAKENPLFYIYTPDGCYTYRIFAVVITEDVSDCYNPDIKNDAEMKEYLELIKRNAMFRIGEAQAQDQIVTLSTCTGRAHGSTRLLIQGYMESFNPTGQKKTIGREEMRRTMKDRRIQAEADAYEEAMKKGGLYE